MNLWSALLLQPDGQAQPLVPASCLCASISLNVAFFMWQAGVPKSTTVHELQCGSARHFEQHCSGGAFGNVARSGK